VRDLTGNVVHLLSVKAGALPCTSDHFELVDDFTSVPGEIGVDKVDDKFGGVHVKRNRKAA